MNDYFIHTFELSTKLSYEVYKSMRNTIPCYPCGTPETNKLDAWQSTTYCEKGITIIMRKCNENERKQRGGGLSHKLIIVINPTKLIEVGSHINRIENREMFSQSLERLDIELKSIFEKTLFDFETIDDLALSRVDVTKDIKEIPGEVITQLILVLWKMIRSRGYEENIQLQERCKDFDRRKSYNIISNSRGIEFVIYNKEKAAEAQNYSAKAMDHYKNTLRMELRCERKFIRKKTKKSMTTTEVLKLFYKSARDYIFEIYSSMFLYRTNLCYLSYPVMDKLLKTKYDNESKKYQKMESVVKTMASKKSGNLEDELKMLFPTSKSKKIVCEYFIHLGVYPVMIPDESVPFIQSLDSILGFDIVDNYEKRIYGFAKYNTRGKEVFLHV